ncbi:MAG: hypothetical protein HC903_04680 [Methylacidiphilales bacterium]|nr:hypothetical protein [Candidatus Methylacidiphilales bacterium]NJR16844.1 hypothetical protein [Calothrix sp. CSU_2_0]
MTDNRTSESRSPKYLKILNIARKSVAIAATVVLVPLAALTFFVVPAPNSETATEVSGKLRRMSQPLLNSDDLQIKLDDGKVYYVNRANEAEYFNWRQLRQDVQQGDTLHLTVVRPLAWRIANPEIPQKSLAGLPVAGIRTDSKIYMNPEIPAKTWKTQDIAQNYSILLFVAIGLCFSPEISRRVQSSRFCR